MRFPKMVIRIGKSVISAIKFQRKMSGNNTFMTEIAFQCPQAPTEGPSSRSGWMLGGLMHLSRIRAHTIPRLPRSMQLERWIKF